MKIIAAPISHGSHGIRVWEKGGPENADPYHLVCNLIHISDDACEVTQAFGNLTNETAILIGMKAMELGYKRLIFNRSIGGLATRWASFVGQKGGMDHYEVDLVQALKAYKERS